MKVVRLIFWVLVALLAFGLVNIGLDLNASTYSISEDGSTLTFTLKTEPAQIGGNPFGYTPEQRKAFGLDPVGYTHHGIDHRLRSEGVSLFVGIVMPLLLIVLSILFEPAILPKLLALSGREASK